MWTGLQQAKEVMLVSRMFTDPPAGSLEVSTPASHVQQDQLHHSFAQLCLRNLPRTEVLQSFWVTCSSVEVLLWQKTSQTAYSIHKFYMSETDPTFSSTARLRLVSALGFRHSDPVLRCQPGRI